MALSFNSIHKPLNDFFLNLFKTDTTSPVLFRFDRFGSTIDNQDFIDPSQPENGYSFNLVREKFSDLVNGIPIEDADGLNIFISQNQIDETYFSQLLAPSLPYIPPEIDGQVKDSIISSFSRIKSEANSAWENIRLESITGLKFQFRPSLSFPENWYDVTKNDAWTQYEFKVTESTTSPPADDTSKNRFWRLKIDDSMMRTLLPIDDNDQPIDPTHLASILKTNKRPIMEAVTSAKPIKGVDIFKDMFQEKVVDPIVNPAVNALKLDDIRGAYRPARLSSTLMRGVIENGTNYSLHDFDHKKFANFSIHDELLVVHFPDLSYSTRSPTSLRPLFNGTTYNLHDMYRRNLAILPIRDKLLITQYFGINANTTSATTNEISISFDYCVIKIKRPWYHDVFVHDKSWFIPNILKGQLTSNDSLGTNIIFMPIGFVAIRNLSIKANWSTSDVENSINATNFGPFKVNSSIVNNTLSHEGIQIIGWLLEKMPNLPPNDFHA